MSDVANMQAGRDLLFKVETGDSPVSYTTIAAMTTTSVAVANNQPDVTNKDSAGKQEFKAGAGNQSLVVSAAGRYVHADAHDRLQAAALNDTEINGQIVFGNAEVWEGAFVISDYNREGPDGDAETFSCTFSRSGAMTTA